MKILERGCVIIFKFFRKILFLVQHCHLNLEAVFRYNFNYVAYCIDNFFQVVVEF